jgi:cytochrome c oxidase accessory protein FixG
MDIQQNTSYRDTLSTVDRSGKRVWIFPKKPKGSLTTARNIINVLLLLFFFSAPFIKINSQPLLLLNFIERKFIILGLVFWPQDFHLFVLATISLIVFIILFTAIFGRIWCGWACPQTVFMEGVFRKIEYWIEGDARHQVALNRAPWTASKILKKVSKHAFFYALSFLVGNTFLAYIIGVEELWRIITDPPSEHVVGLIAMILFSAVFYWVFAFFREQVCTLVCPYGRLQGVLLDPNSIVVAYDFKRGEPRGKLNKSQKRTDFGDCIECKQCVEVCPTGIDIRDGTQLECINCTACIDACNAVMKKVDFPTGLIRYASYTGITEGTKKILTPRIYGYSALFAVLITITLALIFTRNPIETTVLRTPGIMFQETEDGQISNLYNLKIINKTFYKTPIRLELNHPHGSIEMVGGEISVPENSLKESAFFIKIPKDQLQVVNTSVEINVISGNVIVDRILTSFIGPNPWQ